MRHVKLSSLQVQDCRRRYCIPSQIAKSIKQSLVCESSGFEQPTLRSDGDQFCFKSNCLFGQPAILGNIRKSCNALPVRNIKLKDTLLDLCQERKDSWAHSVMARIVNVMICMQQMLFIIRMVMLILVQRRKFIQLTVMTN